MSAKNGFQQFFGLDEVNSKFTTMSASDFECQQEPSASLSAFFNRSRLAASSRLPGARHDARVGRCKLTSACQNYTILLTEWCSLIVLRYLVTLGKTNLEGDVRGNHLRSVDAESVQC